MNWSDKVQIWNEFEKGNIYAEWRRDFNPETKSYEIGMFLRNLQEENDWVMMFDTANEIPIGLLESPLVCGWELFKQ